MVTPQNCHGALLKSHYQGVFVVYDEAVVSVPVHSGGCSSKETWEQCELYRYGVFVSIHSR